MTAAPSKTLLLLGATGEVGRQALLSALASSQFASIHSLGRRAPTLPPTTPNTSKLISTSVNFDSILTSPPSSEEASKFKDVSADAVLVCLGSTRAAAGSFENFYKIDREYVIAAAKAARVEGKHQTLVYCSSGGSDSSSMFPYMKSKGLTEEGLAAIGYDETIIFRPSMLAVPGGRAESRILEFMLAKVTGVLARFSASVEIQTPVLGNALVKAAAEGIAGLERAAIGKREELKGKDAWGVGNPDAIKFGQA